ncbi:hypothetical protein M0R19_04580 [Candidatus Pacearchaeota archaeon]|nr:hypothetical protein [Candidatus Pacearchaeota archaeon]
MSNPGPRQVKEPSPPNRKPNNIETTKKKVKLTFIGKKLQEKTRVKLKKEISLEEASYGYCFTQYFNYVSEYLRDKDAFLKKKSEQVKNTVNDKSIINYELEQTKKIIAKFDKEFLNPNNKLKKDSIFYRGLGDVKDINKFIPGSIIEDKSFISTTPSESYATMYTGVMYNILLKVKVKKGVPVLHVDYSGHSEDILNRNSKIKIKKIKKFSRFTLCEAELL